MALSVAPLYAALRGFLSVYLSLRVIRLRRRLKVALGAVTATRMSAFGGRAEVDFGPLDVCS